MEELLPNTTLSHYHIISKIGAGGMGEVYLAQDTKLDRKVALKKDEVVRVKTQTGEVAGRAWMSIVIPAR